MSERIEKATDALDAAKKALDDGEERGHGRVQALLPPYSIERVTILLSIANAHSMLAQANALERIADALERRPPFPP